MSDPYILSPYLVDVTAASACQDFIRTREADMRVLWDSLAFRAHFLPPDDQRVLEDVVSSGGRVAQPLEPAASWDRLVEREILLLESQAYQKHRYLRIEIETLRQCNFRCGFCPVHDDPKPRAFMAEDLYFSMRRMNNPSKYLD